MRRTIATISDRTSIVLAVFGWLCLLLVVPLWPASFWYSLRSTVVTEDRTPDGHRIMQVDRTIHHDFLGDYRVEEQIKYHGGSYFTIQTCRGAGIRYRRDASLPPVPTLDWWKGDSCRMVKPFTELPAGTYRICTWVTIRPSVLPPKEVSVCSNDFRREMPRIPD